MKPILEKYLPLDSNSSSSSKLAAQRQKDHYSHFILRLAFSSTEDLRRRFTRVETMLFRIRFNSDDLTDRAGFVAGLEFDWWHPVSDEERRLYAAELAAMASTNRKAGGGSNEDEGWFRVDWERVPDLVESRRVFLKAGKAFVPVREQASMVVAEFSSRLEKQLAVSPMNTRAQAFVHNDGTAASQQSSLTNHRSSRPAPSPGSTKTTV